MMPKIRHRIQKKCTFSSVFRQNSCIFPKKAVPLLSETIFSEQVVTNFVDYYTNLNYNSYKIMWEGYMEGIP